MNGRAIGAGFTLLELLLASVVLTVLALVVVQGMRGAADVAGGVAVSVGVLDDVRSAGNLVAAGTGEAVYVYPPGVTLSFGSGWTTRNFVRPGAGSSWRVGEDPILAFVEAPADTSPDVPCRPDDDAPTVYRAACAVFVAYYPLPRREVVARAVGAGHPGADPHDEDVWTLFEYRRTLPFKSFVPYHRVRVSPRAGYGDVRGRVPVARAVLGGASGNLVLDRLAARDGFRVEFVACRDAGGGPETEDGRAVCRAAARRVPTYLAAAISASVRLRAARRGRAGRVTSPGVTVGVTPRNLYAP